jgi:hypothetical protein
MSLSPGKVLVYGIVGVALGEGVKAVSDYAIKQHASPYIVVGLGIAGGSIPLLINLLKTDPARPVPAPAGAAVGRATVGRHPGAPSQPSQPSQPFQPSRSDRRGGAAPLAAAVLVLALVAGAAYGIAVGVQWGVGMLSGSERPIADRLVKPATGTAGPLTVTVDKFEITGHFTKVTVQATNQGSTPITIHLYGSCQLIGADGTTLKPRAGLGGFGTIDVPENGIPVSEVITFDAKPTPAATTMTLSLTGLFAMVDIPHSLQVTGINLKALS